LMQASLAAESDVSRRHHKRMRRQSPPPSPQPAPSTPPPRRPVAVAAAATAGGGGAETAGSAEEVGQDGVHGAIAAAPPRSPASGGKSRLADSLLADTPLKLGDAKDGLQLKAGLEGMQRRGGEAGVDQPGKAKVSADFGFPLARRKRPRSAVEEAAACAGAMETSAARLASGLRLPSGPRLGGGGAETRAGGSEVDEASFLRGFASESSRTICRRFLNRVAAEGTPWGCLRLDTLTQVQLVKWLRKNEGIAKSLAQALWAKEDMEN